MRFFSLLILVISAPIVLQAKLQLPWFFSDNMVLQQQSSPSIWGWTNTKSQVTVITSWNNKKYTAMPDAKGAWKIQIQTPKAGGPYHITISDGVPVKIKNILIGEVWICSGQSNMEMPMKGFKNQPIYHSNDFIFNSDNDHIRLFTVPRLAKATPMDTCLKTNWLSANPKNVSDFSAIGYFFGKYLYDKLKVPIGLINISYGGKPIEAFMDAGSLATHNIKPPHPNASDVSPSQPTVLYNGMIHPAIGYGIKGFIWYQGEGNAGNPTLYELLLPDFVKMLRNQFGYGQFPFYYVQIAPYDYNKNKKPGDELLNSAYLRDAQRKSLNTISNSGMAVTMDIGDSIYIHPRDKQTIGKRLALMALAKTYAYDGFQSESPLYESVTFKKGSATVKFKNAENGLTTYGMPLVNFEIAGSDKTFYPATATINAEGVIVKSDHVKNPVAVRYAFKDFTVGELFNTEGFPASSFRTDDWEIQKIRK